MRCWGCKRLIPVPEHEIKEGELTGQVKSVDITCGTCGTRYQITTARLPGKGQIDKRVSDRRAEDDERAKGRE